MTKKKYEILVSSNAIDTRIKELSKKIAFRLEDDAIIIGLLQGSFVFMADLTRALANSGKLVQTDFLWLSSYGDGQSAGQLKLLAEPQKSVENRQILLIDDVYDTGKTILFAKEYLISKGAKEVLTCVMARKPQSQTMPKPDFIGFDLPDLFLVGYGLDDGGFGRGLPYIGYAK